VKTNYLRFLPWLIVGVAACFVLGLAVIPDESVRGMNLDEFGRLPIVDGGRVKPIDTMARNTLLVLSSRQVYYDDDHKEHSAVEWLLDVMTSGIGDGKANSYKVFRIDNEQVLGLLNLPARSGLRYSITEIEPRWKELALRAMDAKKRQKEGQQLDQFDEKALEVAGHVQLYIELARLDGPLMVPPVRGGSEDWKTLYDTFQETQNGEAPPNPAFQSLAGLLSAYHKGDAGAFNRELEKYRQHCERQLPTQTQTTSFEASFNHFTPFYWCSILYVGVFLLSCLAWLGWTGPLNRSAFWLAVLALLVQTWALGARTYIQGRPPVTNLYSSAIFIGWGSVILCLVLEWLFRNGIGNLLVSVIGFTTLVIAHNLSLDGDTMQMMQAVLDTNFWLATHVTCVTTGYAATFVAGLLGTVFIVRGFLTSTLDRNLMVTLGKMIYGIVCFATFFSFVGTVLGGLWADYSWGRFWGWDPKENGALIIVVWNALILHARWGGMVKQRGMAVLAVFGNIVTAWSWFGVNMLGVGLHSYGFMAGAVFWLTAFVISQLVLVGIGMLPLSMWRSFMKPPLPAPEDLAPVVPRENTPETRFKPGLGNA
jgi:ABC-type transport system involved in cytochrome c biogenesis permease subunit